MTIKEDDLFLNTEYQFTSGIGIMEGSRYLNEYSIKVKASTINDETEKLIGKGRVVLILTGLARNHEYEIFEIFDWSQSLLILGENIYDFDAFDFKKELKKFYNYELLYENICFLEHLELLPEYRGKGLGKKIIKDFTERFSGCCGLFVLNALPLQLQSNNDLGSWYEKMRLNQFVQDEEQAKYKLYSYFQSMGFDQPFKNEYFTMNPAWKNDNLDAIELE